MEKPKFILSKKTVIEQYKKVKKLATVSYSSKTNQDITRILEKETDSMFSVHFETELKHISDLSRAIFLAQAWDQIQIDRLIKGGVRYFVVDNLYDLGQLTNYLDKSDVKINLLLRMKLKENTIRTEKYYVFGMDSELINEQIRLLRKNNKIKKLGVHFHRKTQNMAEWDIKYELSNMLESDVFDLVDIINIGGGIPGDYANTNMDVLPGIFRRIKEFKKYLDKLGIKLIIEPGRFIAAPGIRLSTKIIGIYGKTLVVNASVYQGDMDALIVPVKLLIKGELESGNSYLVKGCTPCSQDIFRYKVFLDNPKVGDNLVFLNAGAYNFTSDFCDLEKIETVAE